MQDLIEEKLIPAKVGGMSLIGVGKERPCSWGNYFTFASGKKETLEDYIAGRSPRCLNMWAENLETACKRFLPDGMVKVRLYTEEDGRAWAIVIDERIPSDWLYNRLCFTGAGRPPLEFAKDMYETLGDPHNELEYWSDPEMYYARKGQVMNERGWVSCFYGEKAEQVLKDLIAKRANERI